MLKRTQQNVKLVKNTFLLKGANMKIPKMLQDYLDETEQDASVMTSAELYEEASWVLSQYRVGEYYNDEYTARDAATLKAFITRISAKMARR